MARCIACNRPTAGSRRNWQMTGCTLRSTSGPRGGAGGANRSDCVFAGLQRLAWSVTISITRRAMRCEAGLMRRRLSDDGWRWRGHGRAQLGYTHGLCNTLFTSVLMSAHLLEGGAVCVPWCGARCFVQRRRRRDAQYHLPPCMCQQLVGGRVGDTGFSSAARRTRADARSVLGASHWRKICVTGLWEENGGV